MEVLTYVPKNVILLVSGYEIQGWTRISIARSTPNFRQIRGIRGKNTRTRIKDSSATLTIETYQTELLNEVFSKCLAADIKNGTVRLEISMKEITGTSLFSSTSAYITGYPELGYSESLGKVTWNLACDESQFYVGAAKNASVGIAQDGISRLKQFVEDQTENIIGEVGGIF